MTSFFFLQDSVIQKARIQAEDDAFHVSAAPKDVTAAQLADVDYVEEQPGDEDAEAWEAMRTAEQTVRAVASTSGAEVLPDKELHSFEIDSSQVGTPFSFRPFTGQDHSSIVRLSNILAGFSIPK